MSTLTFDRPVETPAPSLPDADPNTLMREAVRRALHWFETVGEAGWTQRAAMRDADGQPLGCGDDYHAATMFCGIGRTRHELMQLGYDEPTARVLNTRFNNLVYGLTGAALHVHNDFRGFEPMKAALRAYLDAA